MKKAVAVFLCLLFVFAIIPLPVSAGNKTVVFLKNGGKGDGSSPAKSVGTITNAFDALDLSKDCVIVICGVFDHDVTFDYGKDYSGSVKITSNFAGVDYGATAGAEYRALGCRFVLHGKTEFDDITIRLKENYFFFIANCHPIIFGDGVKTVFDAKPSGMDFASALSILGGYQNGVGMPDMASHRDINVTVLGGEKIFIGVFNRSVPYGNHYGNANITVGGKAKVGAICFTSVGAENLLCGNVRITVKDNAVVNYIFADGYYENVDVNSIVVNWEGGKIGAVSLSDARAIANKPETNNTEIYNPSLIRYSSKIMTQPTYKSVSSVFDTKVRIGTPSDTEPSFVTDAPIVIPEDSFVFDTDGESVDEVTVDSDLNDSESAHVTIDHTSGSGGASADNGTSVTIAVLICAAIIAVGAVIIVLVLKKK